jgi:FkbM family methyltransferase
VAAPLGRVLRTSLYAASSRIPPDRLLTLARHRPAGVALRVAQRCLAGGTVTIAGGAAGRLLLSTDHLPIGHPQGYGLIRGVIEPSVQEALRRHVGPGATVFDIGADIGFFTILSAALAGADGHVHAFEPVPPSAAAVTANAGVNGFTDRVTVHQLAVSDHEGRSTLLIGADRTWSHLSERGNTAGTQAEIDVRLVALDARIDAGELPVPDVLKLDVEGSEIAALTGLSRTLTAHRPVVICELHETNREIAELLGAHEYTVENLDGTAPVLEAGPVHVLGRPRATM